jgi:hypothetical protein
MESELPSTLSPILIGQELLARGHVAQPDLDRALAYQAQSPNDRLGAILVRLGALSEENLVVALADVPRSGVAAALKALRRRRPYGCRSRPGCL